MLLVVDRGSSVASVPGVSNVIVFPVLLGFLMLPSPA